MDARSQVIGTLVRGAYRARLGEGEADLASAQALRQRCFRGRGGIDADAFDATCDHVLVERRSTGDAVACFRLLPLNSGKEIARSYSAQHYDLAPLGSFEGPIVELGRFCIAPDARDADILRIAWAAMTAYVDAGGFTLLFGCSSFPGTDAASYREAFALLRHCHLAPNEWRPRMRAQDVARFYQEDFDLSRAQKALPPLLRTYLAMGGWVSDHAVVDHDLRTLHVFTGVEIARIPAARKRWLRALAND